MKKDLKKYLLIASILLSVTSLALGFAAYQRTLTIQASATVSPVTSNFNVQFSSSKASIETGKIVPTFSDGVTASNATISGTILSDINVNLTGPNQTAFYEFYVSNTGEYDAYLNAIKFNNAIIDGVGQDTNVVCTIPDGSVATPELVQAACEDIKIKIELVNDYNSYDDDYGEMHTYYETNDSLDGISIYKDRTYTAYITISYPINSAIADGPFDVHIGDITLDFSSVD